MSDEKACYYCGATNEKPCAKGCVIVWNTRENRYECNKPHSHIESK